MFKQISILILYDIMYYTIIVLVKESWKILNISAMGQQLWFTVIQKKPFKQIEKE